MALSSPCRSPTEKDGDSLPGSNNADGKIWVELQHSIWRLNSKAVLEMTLEVKREGPW